MGTYSFSNAPVDMTVARTGIYDIIGYGAQGGTSDSIYGGYTRGGLGAEQGGLFNLTAVEQLELIVGGAGQTLEQQYSNSGDGSFGAPTEAIRYGGGGGGTFVLVVNSDGSTTPLLVAGGGGGAHQGTSVYGGTTGAPGTGAGGGLGHDNDGGGPSSAYSGGGGAGVKGSGSSSQDGQGGSNGSGGYYGGGGGASGGAQNGGVFFFQTTGGFGGGGGASPSSSGTPGYRGGHPGGAGGGGGYTGGAGGYTSSGQGGTSFVASSGTPVLAQTMDNENSGDGQLVITPDLACYCTGTLILTDRGAVPIENLAVGDVVLAASGTRRPVKWVGHRRLDLTRHPDPKAVWPVRVAAGAFGERLPSRDLWMSPGHNVYVGNVLMPARVLVNGATVVQVPVDEVTYWHVELDSHDVILAEGLPAESYLDTGNRTAFENGGAFLEMHPDFEPKHWAETCAPIRKSGPPVEAAKAALLARVEQFGHPTTTKPDVHIIADGVRIDACLVRGKRIAFVLPADFKTAALVSRTFVPAHMKPDSTDSRVLGVAVTRLQLDGGDVDLATLAEGWHALERGAGFVRRWTTGTAPLPVGTGLAVVDLTGDARYRVIEQKESVVALCA